ncbi:DUF6296 family protein [Streptomyces sp. NPDC059989]|uniref:DUF6296 family protein n=1 Tax=Streptomyces sp. NPDC059989 TaxID=3347026 RepID=UPI0036AD6001
MVGEDGEDRYELVFEGGEMGAEAADTVVVSRTEQAGPGGHPVYADETGIIRAEISDQGEVRILASGAHQALPRPVRARRPAH